MFKSAGIVYVSNRILNEDLKDESTQFLLNGLNSLNYDVAQTTFVCGKQRSIADHLVNLTKYLDIVILIADLDRNIAFRALADACEEQLCIKQFDGYEVPASAKFLKSNCNHPIVYFSHIYVLEAEWLQQQFEVLKAHLKQHRREVTYKIIVEAQLNGNFKSVLESIKKHRIITEENDKSIKFILENRNLETVVADRELLRESLHEKSVQVFGGSDIFDEVFEANDYYIQQAVLDIQECLKRYGPQNVFLSFNGGKDCTVLLHLTHMVMKSAYPDYNCPIFCLYVKSRNSFVEQDKFIEQCRIFYNLELVEVSLGMKEALNVTLARKPNLKACLMGTRRTDPYSESLNIYQMTDPDWPQVMRVSPLLDWTYCDIWDYLLFYRVPYCKLYDEGYTSLGSPSNTVRNPYLMYWDVESGTEKYLPAYKLLNKTKERDGRNVNKS